MATKQELQWQAESDAHTVAEAAAIKSDPTRLAAAKVAAAKLVTSQQKHAALAKTKAKAMTSLASKPKPKPKAAPKPRAKARR